MIPNRLSQLLAVVIASAVAGCAAVETPPVAQFSGEDISFPVRFLGATTLTGNWRQEGPSAINREIECDYQFGNQSGHFVTSETVVLRFSDERRVLVLDCHFDQDLVVNKGTRRHYGEVTGQVATSYARSNSLKTVGVLRNSSSIRFPRNDAIESLRESVIESKGVQLLPTVIVITPEIRDIAEG